MLRNRALNLALLFCAGAAFLYGIAHLFSLRFEAGDVFPPYSTLRGDPLGAKILYESMRALPDLAVERNEKPLQKLSAGRETALFYLGLKHSFWHEKEIRAFENFVSAGGRLVVSFYPEEKAPERSWTPPPEKSRSKKTSPSPTPEEPMERILDLNDLGKRWNFTVGYNNDSSDATAENQIGLPLEAGVPWHSAMYFPSVADPWRVVYSVSKRGVMIERSFGAGTLVLASDSYFVSNEAMRADRKPALLAWLAGNSRRLVFDETHHHIFEEPGVATLLRKYRLHGLIAGLLALTALFVWKSAASFLPRDRTAGESDRIIAGRDSYSGFTNLLRRGLRPKELMAACVAEWRKSAPRVSHELDEKIASAGESRDGHPREKSSAAMVLRRYEEISRIINESKWKRTPSA
jgi:uncharacterized protein DUF4350